jgi:GxxExxY protein
MIESVEAVNRITQAVIGAAMRVHSALGPGLLESAYETCLAYELEKLGMTVERQKALPIMYRDVRIECGYRLDLLVEETVVVELKGVEAIERVHIAQVLTYLKLSGYPIGLLINFNVVSLKSGIRRVILTPKGAPDAPNHL